MGLYNQKSGYHKLFLKFIQKPVLELGGGFLRSLSSLALCNIWLVMFLPQYAKFSLALCYIMSLVLFRVAIVVEVV